MASLKRTLKEAVRQLAYSTSVEQLKKRGVKQVNVVGLDRICQLIEEAIHRTLKHRLLVAEREAVVDATREEFLRLLRSNEELKQKHERAEEEAGALRLELQRLRQDLDQRLAEARMSQSGAYLSADARIQELVRTALTGFRDVPGADFGDALEHRVLELVMGVVEKERRESEAAKAAARDREVDLLQRRIAKLTSSLQDTEVRLNQVAAAKNFDAGIASVYREVQGLADDDSSYEKKKELMAGIFAANLKLQKGT